jgi:hypothetical protein
MNNIQSCSSATLVLYLIATRRGVTTQKPRPESSQPWKPQISHPVWYSHNKSTICHIPLNNHKEEKYYTSNDGIDTEMIWVDRNMRHRNLYTDIILCIGQSLCPCLEINQFQYFNGEIWSRHNSVRKSVCSVRACTKNGKLALFDGRMAPFLSENWCRKPLQQIWVTTGSDWYNWYTTCHNTEFP